MKYLLFFCFALCLSFRGQAQGKQESLTTNWPPEYAWKVVQRQNEAAHSEIAIIPGNETTSSATIIGVMAANKGLVYKNTSNVVAYFRNGLDEGSVLTVLEQSHDTANLWVLFKVETPKTAKYPEPESDLYYVAQGRYALYDTHVAVKEPALSAAFIERWGDVLKASKIAMQ